MNSMAQDLAHVKAFMAAHRADIVRPEDIFKEMVDKWGEAAGDEVAAHWQKLNE